MKLLKTSAAVNGFTLIEALISLGILAIIFAVGAPIALDFYLNYQLPLLCIFLKVNLFCFELNRHPPNYRYMEGFHL